MKSNALDKKIYNQYVKEPIIWLFILILFCLTMIMLSIVVNFAYIIVSLPILSLIIVYSLFYKKMTQPYKNIIEISKNILVITNGDYKKTIVMEEYKKEFLIINFPGPMYEKRQRIALVLYKNAIVFDRMEYKEYYNNENVIIIQNHILIEEILRWNQ